MFEKLKTFVEACFLHNRIFVNSLASFIKRTKLQSTFLNNNNTMSKPQLETFDSKQKTQKAQKHEKLVFQKSR